MDFARGQRGLGGQPRAPGPVEFRSRPLKRISSVLASIHAREPASVARLEASRLPFTRFRTLPPLSPCSSPDRGKIAPPELCERGAISTLPETPRHPVAERDETPDCGREFRGSYVHFNDNGTRHECNGSCWFWFPGEGGGGIWGREYAEGLRT